MAVSITVTGVSWKVGFPWRLSGKTEKLIWIKVIGIQSSTVLPMHATQTFQKFKPH